MLTELSQFDFHHRLAELPGPSLVMFSAPACGACRAWRRVLERTGGVRCFEVNVQRDTALAREFDVFHLPTLVLFVGGRFHAFLNCAPETAAILATVDRLAALPPEEEP